MAINHWPEKERPREKLIEKGPTALTDAELLAIFIRTGTPGNSAIDIGRNMLQQFDGIRSLLNADRKTLYLQPGFGPAKYALLQAALELGKRYYAEKLYRGQALSCSEEVADHLKHQLRDQQREVFAVLLLDTRHRVIRYEELFYGTLNGASVHPRELVKNVLSHNAAAVIIAHNHPSGIAEPSQSDLAITKRIKNALELIDVKLLDHLIIGDGEFVSLGDRGLL